ncbi:alpha-mannosidase [Fodinisporobacter ferrooxydans]|uniref:Alpha-mannosidase n=1 Tax=Fodinisporobacter ferrooxydans TaxID=2901836 RepID=A0ABY4CEB8_9BACL|nr:alpha-mannosidase [Alicyclobacillaceae bacterium MYW30-H2]
MFWTEEKLSARIKELNRFRYREMFTLGSFQSQEDEEGAIGARPPSDGNWQTIQVGDRWKGRDRYLWLTANVDIPATWTGRAILGIFDFGKTGGGGNSGFESLLYVNGRPYQGVDSNHQEVFLPEGLIGGKVSLQFRLWSGLEGGGQPTPQDHELKRADLGWLDEDADDLYYTAKAVLETVHVLTESQPERMVLLTALDRSFLQIDWSEPGSESFYASIREARSAFRTELQSIQTQHPVTIYTIGHTHIDVAWLWRLKHTREKAARSFSTVLRLMEKFPEYIFLQTQPQLYEYIKNDYPEIYEKIKDRVQEGRWEAGGAMWLEADCNLTSGESLVRQILMGTRFFRDEFGVECKYLWLPDVFGYSWALPQILKKSGIDTFMTTKISWNQYNRMPHDTFKWRGMDGTEVLTHFITTPEVENPDKWWYTYNGQITPVTAQGIWKVYRDKSINQELLLSYGYGDGGGGVNREMLEMRRRLEDMPGLPKVVTGRADEFFKKLNDCIEKTEQYVHTWDGELYLEYHRGTYTSQAYNKRMNRKLELLYRETEWMNVVQSVFKSDWSLYPQTQLNNGWKIILRNQFHDIIPGSSIHEVYQDSKLEYAEANEIAANEWKNSAKTIVSELDTNTFTVFNSAPWTRTDLVHIPMKQGMEYGKWYQGEHALSAQVSEDGWHVQVQNMPSMGLATIRFESERNSEEDVPFVLKENGLATPYYELEWNEFGQLVRIFDLEANREVLADGANGNVLQVFEDKPKMFEAWDIDLFYQEKKKEITQLQSCKVTEIGSIRTVVRFEWMYKHSTIVQNLVVYRDCKRIDFHTTIDWHEKQQLLKVAFPVDVRSTEATYDIQYGNVKRPTHWNTSWDQAKFETVGHQWADLSEQGYGVSLLNDCKYGHDIKDNVIRLSLIKSATYPDTQADQGTHVFTYSLLPHTGSWFEGNTVQEAWALNSPLTFVQGRSPEEKFSLFQTAAKNVMIDAVKKAEDQDQLVLRVHDFSGGRGTVEISSDLIIQFWQETDLLERPIGEISNDSNIKFDLKPYEIKTFLINLAKM